MSDYYDEVVKGYRHLEGNKDAIHHFFQTTEPEGNEPKHSRAMDIDKAIAMGGEFIEKCASSVIINTARRWHSEPDALLPSPDALEQPLDYYHSNQDKDF